MNFHSPVQWDKGWLWQGSRRNLGSASFVSTLVLASYVWLHLIYLVNNPVGDHHFVDKKLRFRKQKFIIIIIIVVVVFSTEIDSSFLDSLNFMFPEVRWLNQVSSGLEILCLYNLHSSHVWSESYLFFRTCQPGLLEQWHCREVWTSFTFLSGTLPWNLINSL